MSKQKLTCAFGLLGVIFVPASSFAASTVSLTPDRALQTSSKKPINANGEVNALRLRCTLSETRSKLSYATVFKLNASDNKQQKFDVAVTTGHGLLGDDGKLLNTCFVSTPGGKAYPVKAAKLAPNYKPGTPTDWAVLIVPKHKHKKLIRYTVGSELTQETIATFAKQRPSVLFATARGLPVNGQTCEIEPRRFAGLQHRNFAGFLSHTCRAISGQSGAPISIQQGNTHILLGIHVGNSMVYGYPTMDTPLHYRGYLRGIDAEFMAEFSQVFVEIKILQLNKKNR